VPGRVPISGRLSVAPSFATGARIPKIFFAGDSLTAGNHTAGSFRVGFYQIASGAAGGFPFQGVGSSIVGEDATFQELGHDSHAGFRILDLNTNILVYLQDAQPDFMFLMIGTNNLATGDNITQPQTDYTTLLTTVKTNFPSGLYTYCLDLPVLDNNLVSVATASDVKRQAFNSALPATVAAMNGNFSFLSVSGDVLTSDLQTDGIHPAMTGCMKIAGRLFNGVVRGGNNGPYPLSSGLNTPSWTPSSEANLVGQWHAANAVVSSGAVVSIPDSGGAGNTLTATGTPGPTYNPHSFLQQFNSRPTFTCDGSQNFLKTAAGIVDTTSNGGFTIALLVRKDIAALNATAMCGQMSSGNSQCGLSVATQGQDLALQVGATSQTALNRGPGGGNSTGGYNQASIIIIQYDGTNWTHIRNGTSTRQITLAGAVATTNPFTVGAIQFNGVPSYSFGNFEYESIVVWNKILNATALTNAAQFLGRRAGIPVT
jgi:hypothetical protein